MIDNFAVFVTCAGAIYVAWRAAQLDAVTEWFPPVARLTRRSLQAWRRR